MTSSISIRHHLTDDLLLGYAAGHLSEAFGLVVATHVSLCDDCRARLESYEALGGAVIEGEAEEAISFDALSRIMARLDVPVVSAPPLGRGKTSLPAPVAAYVGGGVEAVKWRSVGMGVRQAILPTGPQATARLLHIPAGQAVPDHGHRGTGLTLVLRGAFRDATDRFGPGDLEIADEDVLHKPIAEAGEDCICLAATDAPLRFVGFLPRLLQPLFRV